MKYNNNKQLREYLRLIRRMNPKQKEAFEAILEDVKKLKQEAHEKDITKKQFTKALFIVDMNNGFVNFGKMANPDVDKYNDLVPEQLKLVERFRRDEQLVNFIMEGHVEEATEFLTNQGAYPTHCVLGTGEAELIPQFKLEEEKENTNIYYKNSINGGLNLDLQIDLENLKDLREIVISGVCTDLCVLDFARTIARFMDEINHKVSIFVIESTVSTFNAPGHNKEEESEIAYHVMKAAGIEIIKDFQALEEREKALELK